MTLLTIVILACLIVALFYIPNVPPLLRTLGAVILFIVILWIVLGMLGLVAPLHVGRVK